MTRNDLVQRWCVAGLHAVALGLAGLQLYVRTLPATFTPIPAPESTEAHWWGLWPVTYLPGWAVAMGVVTVVAPILLWWLRAGWRADAPVMARPLSRRTAVGLIFLSALLLAAFFVFPVVHTRWGDAYMLARGIAYPDPALRLTHSWQAPLDVFLHSQVWLALHGWFAWEDAMPAYRLLSPAAGMIYLGVVLALSDDTQLAPPWLTYGLLATLGLMQLFFGYVENYSFAAAGVLAYLWLGLGALKGRRPLWLAALVLAVTHATHPSTVVLAPSLIYLGWAVWGGDAEVRVGKTPERNTSAVSIVLQLALPMALVGGATFVWMEVSGHGLYALLNTDRPGGGDARWFVPLWTATTRWEHYTMFSWPHLRDWINEQLLVAPVVLPALCVVLAAGWRLSWNAVARFLTIAASCYLLFTFVWNSDYGGQRDWDLFALAALPTTLLLIVRLPTTLPTVGLLWGGAVPLIAVQAWHTVGWIYQNTLPWQWPD